MTHSSEVRAAIVTGGASGIGRACVERLLAAGWRVTILDLDAAALDRVRAQLGDRAAVRVAGLDVTDEPAAVAAIDDAVAAFGRLDGVVNSAGIAADLH